MAEDRVTRMHRRICEIIQQEIEDWLNDLMRGVLDPSKILAFAKAMGIDMSQLPGMMGRQPGFDPYLILGLKESASDDEVRHRYLQLMNKLHPDRAGQEFRFLATLVNVAYQAICRERGIR